MPANITYRLFQDSDLPGVLRLWEEASGWGAPTPELWRQWYRGTPFGDAIIAVAMDESGAIAGQESFIPARVVVDEREVKAWRLSAPILRSDLRQHSLRDKDHPTVRLYQTAIHSAAAQGSEIVYALPEAAWLPVFKVLAQRRILFFAGVEFECVELPLDENFSGSSGSSFVVRTVEEFGDEYTALWQTARNNFPLQCGVERSPAWLGYKNGGHLTLAAYDQSNTLAGYVAINRRTGLIADCLARHPADTVEVLAAIIRHLTGQRLSGLRATPDTLKAMRTPQWSAALTALGFAAVDFRFAFVCSVRDPADSPLNAQMIAPDRWYVTPGD